MIVIAEGKTKKILQGNIDHEVLIQNKDSITAGDGARKSKIKDKGILATCTTSNVFEYLNKKGVKTHFIQKVSENTFKAREIDMIPIELVARRVAYGSYLKRNPRINSGTILDEIQIEFFFKDDSRGDPLMILSDDKYWDLYDSKKPVSKNSWIGLIPKCEFNFGGQYIEDTIAEELDGIVLKVFELLEEAWANQNVLLVDMKIECGFDTETRELLVADVIDNDSWRIWPRGDESKMKDKETYRILNEPTKEKLSIISDNYRWVAEATQKFLE